MLNVYKITHAGGTPVSPNLMGLLIIQTDDEIYLIDAEQPPHEAPRQLSPPSRINIGGPPYAQFTMQFRELYWTINVNTLPSSTGELSGTWQSRKHPSVPDEEDNWTAKGTGTGTGTGDDDEARAASATY
jgi:hypothetical protein